MVGALRLGGEGQSGKVEFISVLTLLDRSLGAVPGDIQGPKNFNASRY